MNGRTSSEHEVEPGERYRLTGREEPFTVVDVDDVTAMVQYDGGAAEDYRLNSNGQFLDSHITKLSGDGPTVADACSADAHEFLPSLDDIGLYQTLCRRCNLSVITLIDHAGQLVDKSLPWQCPDCGSLFNDLNSSGGLNSEGERICSKCHSGSTSNQEK